MPRYYTITDPTGELTIDFNHVNPDTGLLIPDGNGVFWSIEELEGWDGPDVRQVLVDPYGEDGIIVGVNELAGRLITLTNGFALAPTEEARWVAELQFGQLLAATVPQGQAQVVVHEDLDRLVTGYLASKPEWKEVPPGSAAQLPNAWPFQFEASLICPIPVKQSSNESSPFSLTRDGTDTVPTLGNYPIWPIFIVQYPCNNDTLTDQLGHQIQFTSANRGSNAAPPMPTQITLDVYNRTCTDQDGFAAWDIIAAFDAFQLLPQSGSTVSYHLGSASPTGTQEAQVGWSDAWL